MYFQKHRDARRLVEAVQGYVERFEVRAGARNDIARAMSAWQLAIEEALVSLEGTPPTEFAVRDGTRMLNLGARLYIAFMGTARGYLERRVPPNPSPPGRSQSGSA